MKKIVISIPCFNEESNVIPITEEILDLFTNKFPQYKCIVQFIDNNSTDKTRIYIRKLCKKYPENVRAIFNAKNFPLTSGYYGLLNAVGDCTISIPCDFQVPISMLTKMIHEWEKGAKIVCLIKKSSEENGIIWQIRQFYYKIANRFNDSHIVKNFTGSGLYDKSILDICRKLNDTSVSFFQFIYEFGYDITELEYIQKKRINEKSKNSFFSLVNIGITRFINSSTVGLRVATVLGIFSTIVCLLIAFIYLILKLLYWDNFSAGIAPLLIGFFLISSIQLFFIGLVGEYVIRANKLLNKKPLVVERERINFKNENKK